MQHFWIKAILSHKEMYKSDCRRRRRSRQQNQTKQKNRRKKLLSLFDWWLVHLRRRRHSNSKEKGSAYNICNWMTIITINVYVYKLGLGCIVAYLHYCCLVFFNTYKISVFKKFPFAVHLYRVSQQLANLSCFRTKNISMQTEPIP